jgi:polyisoprenyl-phosphate glycosyltransferase
MNDPKEGSPMKPTRRKCISIVTPCYNEEDNVADCHAAVRELFATELADYDCEHVFCDNASTDATPVILEQLAAEDPGVKVILHAGNFGVFRSMFNGLMATSGDAVVVLLAADLQDPPELIVDFVGRWEQGFDIVYGIRAEREEGRLLQFSRHVYYQAVSRLGNVRMLPQVSEFQLIDRAVVEALRRFDDYYPYLRGMIAYCGFRSIGIPHAWKARRKGLSKNHLHSLVDQGLNGLVAWTTLPLRLCMLFGAATALAGATFGLSSMALSAFYYHEITGPGIPALLAAVVFFAGVILFVLGYMSEYLMAIQAQVRRRPAVVERKRMNFTGVDGSPTGGGSLAGDGRLNPIAGILDGASRSSAAHVVVSARLVGARRD